MSGRALNRWGSVATVALAVAGMITVSAEIKPTPAPISERESIQRYLMASGTKPLYYLKVRVDGPQLSPGKLPPTKPVNPGSPQQLATGTDESKGPRATLAVAGGSRVNGGDGPLVPTGGGVIAPSRVRVLSALESVSRALNR